MILGYKLTSVSVSHKHGHYCCPINSSYSCASYLTAMFSKKPRRNLRVRDATNEESENEHSDSAPVNIIDKTVKKPKKPVAHQPLLSFEEDLNEGNNNNFSIYS